MNWSEWLVLVGFYETIYEMIFGFWVGISGNNWYCYDFVWDGSCEVNLQDCSRWNFKLSVGIEVLVSFLAKNDQVIM